LLREHKSGYNQKSDIWSLGCILYELITGEKAFNNDFVVRDYANSQEQERETTLNMVSVPALWKRWLREMLQVEPQKRPSAEQTGEMIWEFISYGRNDQAEAISTSEKIKMALKSENMLASDLPTKPWMLDFDDVLSRRGDQHKDTLARYKRLVKTRSLLMGPNHAYTLWSMQCYACGQYDLGLYGEAAELFEKIYEIKRSELGLEHQETLSIRCGLAAAYSVLKIARTKKKKAAAGKLFNDLLLDMQRILGPEHPETLSCKAGLAVSLIDLNNIKAVEHFDEVIAAQKRVLGKDHPETLRSIAGLAWLRHLRDEQYEAYYLYKVAMETQLDVLGPDHPDTIDSVSGFANVCISIGKMDLAQSNFADAERWKNIVFGDWATYI